VRKTLLLITAMLVALGSVGFAAYTLGHNKGYADGYAAGETAGFKPGYDEGYNDGLVDGEFNATLRELTVKLGDVVYDQTSGNASFQIFVDIEGDLASSEDLVMVCHAPNKKNPIDWHKFDVTYRDGYYNWENFTTTSVMLCKAQITDDDGTVVIESNEIELSISSASSS